MDKQASGLINSLIRRAVQAAPSVIDRAPAAARAQSTLADIAGGIARGGGRVSRTVYPAMTGAAGGIRESLAGAAAHAVPAARSVAESVTGGAARAVEGARGIAGNAGERARGFMEHIRHTERPARVPVPEGHVDLRAAPRPAPFDAAAVPERNAIAESVRPAQQIPATPVRDFRTPAPEPVAPTPHPTAPEELTPVKDVTANISVDGIPTVNAHATVSTGRSREEIMARNAQRRAAMNAQDYAPEFYKALDDPRAFGPHGSATFRELMAEHAAAAEANRTLFKNPLNEAADRMLQEVTMTGSADYNTIRRVLQSPRSIVGRNGEELGRYEEKFLTDQLGYAFPRSMNSHGMAGPQLMRNLMPVEHWTAKDFVNPLRQQAGEHPGFMDRAFNDFATTGKFKVSGFHTDGLPRAKFGPALTAGVRHLREVYKDDPVMLAKLDSMGSGTIIGPSIITALNNAKMRSGLAESGIKHMVVDSTSGTAIPITDARAYIAHKLSEIFSEKLNSHNDRQAMLSLAKALGKTPDEVAKLKDLLIAGHPNFPKETGESLFWQHLRGGVPTPVRDAAGNVSHVMQGAEPEAAFWGRINDPQNPGLRKSIERTLEADMRPHSYVTASYGVSSQARWLETDELQQMMRQRMIDKGLVPAGETADSWRPHFYYRHGRSWDLTDPATALRKFASAQMVKTADVISMIRRVAEGIAKRPKLEGALRGMSHYRLMDPANALKNTVGGSLAGGAIGTAGGAISGIPDALKSQVTEDQQGRALPGLDFLPKFINPEVTRSVTRDRSMSERMHKLMRNTLVGQGTGLAAGAAAGRFGPRLAQKGIGRVLTNVMDPISYDAGQHASNLGRHSFKDLAKAVWNDKPADPLVGDAIGRSHHFRNFFGLQPHEESRGFFKAVGNPADRTFKFNAKNPHANAEMRGIAQKRVDDLEEAAASGALPNEPRLLNKGHMGNFHVNPDGGFKDEWDFALHPNERIDSATNLLRAMVTPFGLPSTTVGRTLSETAAARRTVAGRAATDARDAATRRVIPAKANTPRPRPEAPIRDTARPAQTIPATPISSPEEVADTRVSDLRESILGGVSSHPHPRSTPPTEELFRTTRPVPPNPFLGRAIPTSADFLRPAEPSRIIVP